MRILIVKLGAIGDVVHTLPAIAVLRREIPSSHLSWIVENGGAASLLRDNPLLDELLEVDLKHQSLRDMFSGMLKRLREGQYDLAIDFQGLLKSACIPWLARVPRRVGFDFAMLREPAAGLLLTERVKADDSTHVIKKNLRLVEHLDCQIDSDYCFPIAIGEQDEQFAFDQTAQAGGPIALINPGGGWPTKLWGAARFGQIADRLWNHFGLRSLITFGPDEEMLALAVAANSTTGAARPVKSTLKQFYALAKQASLFIGGDTGPMHLAAAANTPIVGLFGPTSSRRNGPFAVDDVVIERTDIECRVDCYRRRCSHISCMDLPVEMVWRGVVKRLSASGYRI